MNLFSLMAKISIDDKGFNSGVDRSERKFSGFGKKVTGVIAGLGIAKLGKDTLKLGIDTKAMAETSGVAWTTLLGSQEKSKKMLDDISKFAATTPFEKMGVDNMAKQLHNAGFSGQALFDQLRKFGDLGGAFGVQASSLEEMVRQYAQVKQSGVAYTEDLNILRDRGIPIYKAIAEQLGINTEDVKKWASEGKISAEIYQAALDELAKGAEGGMESQSKTFIGMVSTFSDGMAELAGILARPIFDALKEALEVIQPKLDEFTRVLGEEGLMAALDTINPGLSELVKNLGFVASAFVGAFVALKLFAAFTAVVGFVQGLVTAFELYQGAVKGATLAQKLLNIELLIGFAPIYLIIAVIGLLVGAFIYLWNTSDAFRNFWINLWESIKNACSTAWEWMDSVIHEKIPTMINNISNWFSELPGKIWQWLTETVNKVTEWAGNMVQKGIDAATRFVDNVITWISNLPSKVMEWLTKTLDNIGKWAEDMIKKGGKAAEDTVKKIIDGFKKAPGEVLKVGADIVTGLWKGISGKGGWLWDKVSGFASNILKTMKGALGIHSPSRKAAKEIGQWIPPGIGVGMDRAMPKLEDGLQSNMDSLVGNVNVKGRGILSSVSGQQSTPAPIQLNLNIENLYNNRDQDIRQLAEELTFYLRDLNYSTGLV